VARPASDQPTDGELEILKILWETGPAELRQVCSELRKQRPVATTTAATMLQVMLGKGLVKRSRGERQYVWSAARGEKVTTRRMLRSFVDRVFDGSAELLMVHLLEDGQLSERDREEIRRMLESRQKRDKR